MVKNSSKNNRKHVGKSVKSKRKVSAYVKGAAAVGWNPKRTVRQNQETSGLATALNDHASIIRHRGVRLSKSTTSEFLAMVEDELPSRLAAGVASRSDFFMKDEEVLYLQPLVDKYRDNYMAMFRDMRLNNLQHSAQHLETRCKRLMKFLAVKTTGAGSEGASSSSSSSSAGAGAAPGMEVERPRRKSLKVIDQPNLAGDDEDWEKLAQVKLKVLAYGKLR